MGFLPQDSSNTGFLPHRIPPKRDSSHVGFLLLDSSHGITPTLDSSHKGFLPQWMPPIQDSYKTRNFQHDIPPNRDSSYTGLLLHRIGLLLKGFLLHNLHPKWNFFETRFPAQIFPTQDSLCTGFLSLRNSQTQNTSFMGFLKTKISVDTLTKDSSHMGLETIRRFLPRWMLKFSHMGFLPHRIPPTWDSFHT